MAQTKKRWTVLHYLVAVTDRRPGVDEALRAAAEEELAGIAAAARDHLADMHVAYQLEFWDGVGTAARPVRRLRTGRWTAGAPIEATSDPFEDLMKRPRRADDIRKFFMATGDPASPLHCPSDHVAVFFWGHSAGPAGIFDLLAGSTRPLPTLIRSATALADRLPAERARRLRGFISLPHLSGAFAALPQRCDLVVFKDCWMSTLEAACELAEHVDTAIASQSQVPVTGVWPYPKLYRALAGAGDGADQIEAARFKPLVKALADRYATLEARLPDADGRPAFPSVPFSLLDLTKASEAQAAFGGLAKALGRKSALSGAAQSARSKAFDAASTGPLPGTAGDIALVDVRTLCDRLAPLVPAAAIAAVRRVVNDVVVDRQSRGPADNCTGLSLFYHPSKQRLVATPAQGPTAAGVFDNLFLKKNVLAIPYGKLALNRLADRWSSIAFEQKSLMNQLLFSRSRIMADDKGPGFGLSVNQMQQLSLAFEAMASAFGDLQNLAAKQPQGKAAAETCGAIASGFTDIATIWNDAASDASETESATLTELDTEVKRLRDSTKRYRSSQARRRMKAS